MRSLGELRTELRIDINNLHLDAQAQPSLMEEAGSLTAELKAEAKRAKLLAEEAKANAAREIRANPGDFGLSKVTESAVEAGVTVHADVTASQRAYIDASEAADKADSVYQAFCARKSMLQVETQLFSANYWGSPEVTEQQVAPTVSWGKNAEEDKYKKKREEDAGKRRGGDTD